MRRLCALPVVALCGAAATAIRPSSDVSWIPREPAQGTFVVVRVVPDSTPGTEAAITGMLAGQPLHFERTVYGDYRALGAIPVHAERSLPLTVEVTRPGLEPEHRFERIPVASTAFATEQLTVDPRYAAEPDSALAARIASERAAAWNVSRRSHRTPRLWYGAFVRPTEGRVTSEYGKGREFNGTLQSRHMGVDFAGDRGTPVVAANRGIVALIGEFYYGGRSVYLDHGRGLVTAYLHLSDVAAAQGDSVRSGQVIGYVGATGRVTGPHLHWIARYGTVTVDALGLLEQDWSAFALPESTVRATR